MLVMGFFLFLLFFIIIYVLESIYSRSYCRLYVFGCYFISIFFKVSAYFRSCLMCALFFVRQVAYSCLLFVDIFYKELSLSQSEQWVRWVILIYIRT